MVRRARHPGGLQQIFAAQDQAGALRSAQALAAAVAHEGGAALQIDVGDGQHLGRGVGEHRNVLLLGDAVDGVVVERAALHPVAGHDVDHRDLRSERGLVLRRIAHFDDAHAHRADRLIVLVARGLRNHHLVLGEARQIRNAHVQVGIAAGDAGRRGVRHARRAARGHQGPLRAGQFGQAARHAFHQLVQNDVMLPAGIHGRPHFRQFERTADDGQGAAAVDQRPDADRLVDIRAEAKFAGRQRERPRTRDANRRGAPGRRRAIRLARNRSRRPNAAFMESNIEHLLSEGLLVCLIIPQARASVG